MLGAAKEAVEATRFNTSGSRTARNAAFGAWADAQGACTTLLYRHLSPSPPPPPRLSPPFPPPRTLLPTHLTRSTHRHPAVSQRAGPSRVHHAARHDHRSPESDAGWVPPSFGSSSAVLFLLAFAARIAAAVSSASVIPVCIAGCTPPVMPIRVYSVAAKFGFASHRW